MTEFAIRDARLEDSGAMAEIIADGREQAYDLTPGSWEHHSLVANWRGQSGAGIVQRYLQVQGEWARIGDRPRARVATHLGSGAIVGVMTSRQIPVGNRDGVNLDFLFVDPSTQGQGVGRMLMGDFTEHAAGRAQSLEVRAGNERAQNLYRQYGFVAIGMASGLHRPSTSIEMVKPAEHA